MKHATVSLLLQAIEKLLTDKTIEVITIDDVLALSGVSRSTFYRYFSDKHDLCTGVLRTYIEDLIDRGVHNDLRMFLCSVFAHMKEKQRFYYNVFSYMGQNSYFHYFDDHVCEQLSMILFKENWHELPLEKSYFLRYHCCAIAGIMLRWIFLGCKEEPAFLCDIIFSNMYSSSYKELINP